MTEKRESLFPARKPRLLDLFCGAGGCSAGYARAGFDVEGVDIDRQPNYPFTFHQGDALEVGARLLVDGGFDAIHASPPCQAFTTMSNRYRGAGGAADSWPDLIEPTRALLRSSGLPWVIENVEGAARSLRSPVLVCGYTIGLERLKRHRLFESNVALLVPNCICYRPGLDVIGVYGARPDGRRLNTRMDGSEQRAAASVEEAREAMGIDWMDWRELCEAIPPAYTELLGEQLIRYVPTAVAA